LIGLTLGVHKLCGFKYRTAVSSKTFQRLLAAKLYDESEKKLWRIKNGTYLLYHHGEYGGTGRGLRKTLWTKRFDVFCCCLFITLLNGNACERGIAIKPFELRIGLSIIG